eukprot:TRINITY_DN3345_c0_g1_i2.p1 TRINITY_DN3345_c0_g1~~TRINITY_DN3345_c0_g1_i2.p1  ORF type:complete len:212 (+),score=39.79 TRINITY_DN3345_c0_g1_i2:203-838(+)
MNRKPILYYFGDPMCSWCWGFAPTIEQVRQQFKDQFDVKLVIGGLRPGQKEPVDTSTKNFLTNCWTQVNKASGQPFNFGLLERNDFVYDTLKPSLAIVAVRQLADEDTALEFYHDVQKAFYQHNHDTNDINTYIQLLPKYGIDAETFRNLYASDDLRDDTYNDFAIARSFLISGFPALALVDGEIKRKVSSGWQSYDMLEPKINAALVSLE